MKIEILASDGNVFTQVETTDPESDFANARTMYGEENASSWREYAPPARTAQQACDEKRAAINAKRDELEAASPFTYNGHNFDYDAKSRERLHAAISAALVANASGVSIDMVVTTWTLYDNTTMDMTVGDFLGIPTAEAERSGALHETARRLKQAVDDALAASKTTAEIDALPVWE